MYIVGQERRLVDPPSQVVAGVRTVTTNMDGRDALPRMSRPFAFVVDRFLRVKSRPEIRIVLNVLISNPFAVVDLLTSPISRFNALAPHLT